MSVAATSNTIHDEEVLLSAGGVPYVSIILPTFNESKNVVELLRLIDETMKTHSYEYECVFVDDSYDATPEVVRTAASLYPNQITLIKRKGAAAKTGLTMAFKRGFESARGDIIVCMDTDLQHPPATIAKLVAAVAANPVDVVVASRYTRGGSAEGLNGFFRKFVSKASNYYVWMLLPSTRQTTDPMTGFFAFRKSLLNTVAFSSLGFKILVELLAAIEKPQVIDIPFSFQQRKEDESKATMKQGIVAYRDIFSLFLTESRGSTLVKVMIVASGVTYLHFMVVLLASSQFFMEAGVNTMSASIILSKMTWFQNTALNFDILTPLVALVGVAVLFRFALAKYNFHKISPKNLLLGMIFLVGIYSITLTILPFMAVFVGVTLAKSFSLFAAFIIAYVCAIPVLNGKHVNVVSPEKIFLLACLAFVFLVFSYFLDFSIWWVSLLIAVYSLVIAQGLFALFLMIYAWENDENTKSGLNSADFSSPAFSFTAIVPCKHEKNTIADTIRAMHRLSYPQDKKQILIVIHEGSDDGTIGIVNETIAELHTENIQLVTFNESPVNKPHGLNKALEQATGDFVAIFDAEDEPHTDLLRVVNTALLNTNADVLQSGVQLMNYDSNWYSIFNVLEYYFWFKSSLHFYAKNKVAPLGGVSVFFRRVLLQKVGGWDVNCLTEDAEVGIRLSQIGAKVAVIYSAKYATREETPPTLVSFVKQRTRWAQGFLQILARGSFRNFPTFKQRFLAVYILSWPLIIPFAALLLPFGIFMMSFVSLPPALALLSNIPLLLFLGFILTLIVGFYEFTREYGFKFSPYYIIVIILLYYPYTLLLVVASVRAIYRNVSNITVWEKTEHINKHREQQTRGMKISLAAAVNE